MSGLIEYLFATAILLVLLATAVALGVALFRSKRELVEKTLRIGVLEGEIAKESSRFNENLEMRRRMEAEFKLEIKTLSDSLLKQGDETLKAHVKVQQETHQHLIKSEQERIEKALKTLSETQVKSDLERAKREGEILSSMRHFHENAATISKEAQNLTRALTEHPKTRGNFGETQFQMLLEHFSFVQGQDYEVQKTVEGGLRPDFIIRLPSGRALIVDVKHNLNHYLEYIGADNKDTKQQAWNSYVKDVNDAIDGLEKRAYSRHLEGAHADVFMYIPNESAFATLSQNAGEVFEKAAAKRVILLSRSSFFVMLNLLQDFKRGERQQHSLKEMAETLSKIYQKLMAAQGGLLEVHKSFEDAQQKYGASLAQLYSGRGNLREQIEKLEQSGFLEKRALSSTAQGRLAHLEESGRLN